MKNSSLSIRLLILLILTSWSCNKDTGVIHVENLDDFSADLMPRNTVIIDASNPSNPIDSIGFLHNKILDRIAFHPNFTTMPIISSTYSFAEEEGLGGMSTTIPYSSAEPIIMEIWEYCNDDNDTIDIEGAIDYMATLGNFSQNLVEELKDLFSVLSLERENVSIGDLIDVIIDKENNFPARLFSTHEQNIYYGTASVLRYSASYWDAVIEDESESHPYYNILEGHLNVSDEEGIAQSEVKKFPWKKIWRGIAVIAADALGFAGGYALGSAIGVGVPAAGIAAGTLIGTATSAEVRNIWNP